MLSRQSFCQRNRQRTSDGSESKTWERRREVGDTVASGIHSFVNKVTLMAEFCCLEEGGKAEKRNVNTSPRSRFCLRWRAQSKDLPDPMGTQVATNLCSKGLENNYFTLLHAHNWDRLPDVICQVPELLTNSLRNVQISQRQTALSYDYWGCIHSWTEPDPSHNHTSARVLTGLAHVAPPGPIAFIKLQQLVALKPFGARWGWTTGQSTGLHQLHLKTTTVV